MKMKQKGIAPLIIVAIVVVVAVAGVGAYVVVSRGGGGGGGGGAGGDIASATSLSFNVDSTAGGVTSTMTFKAKDIGSSNMKIRIEGTAAGQEFKYIINGAQQKLWIYAAGQWMDLSSSFSEYWGTWNQAFTGYTGSLSGWTGGTWTSPDGTVTISDIVVNPDLSDSLFQP